MTDTSSGYTQDGCSYLYHPVENSPTTVVWIPGGGLAGFIFAFSGVGPYLIRGGRLRINPNRLPVSPLFIDVGGVGFSQDNYPQTDNEMVQKYVRCIENFQLDNLILVGVSYGGKLALQIAKNLPTGTVRRVVAITPFFNARHSEPNIPRTLARQGKHPLDGKDLIEYNRLKEEFEYLLRTGQYGKARRFVEDGGLFAQLSSRLLKIPGKPNLWNASLFSKPTLSNWSIPNTLADIQRFLSSRPKYNFLQPLYQNNQGVYTDENSLQDSNYMINSLSWKQLAWSENSYLKGVQIDNLPYPFSIISGDIDVATSFDGHHDLWRGLGYSTQPNPQNKISGVEMYQNGNGLQADHLFRVANGTHLLLIAYPRKTQQMFSQMY